MKKPQPVKKTLIKTVKKASQPAKNKAIQPSTYTADRLLRLMPFGAQDYLDQVVLILQEHQETCQWEMEDLAHYLGTQHNELFHTLTKKSKLAYQKQLKTWTTRHKQTVSLQKLCQQLQADFSALNMSRVSHSPLAC